VKSKRIYRCSICNKVSDPSIETEVGDTVRGHFHPDPKYRESYLCDACDTSIDILMSEYHLMDEKEERIWNFPF